MIGLTGSWLVSRVSWVSTVFRGDLMECRWTSFERGPVSKVLGGDVGQTASRLATWVGSERGCGWGWDLEDLEEVLIPD